MTPSTGSTPTGTTSGPSGAEAAWYTPASAKLLEEAGIGRLPKATKLAPEDALARFKRERGWRDRLALLGALFAWRTMTSEQAAAFVGKAGLARATGQDAVSAFAADLIELGAFRCLPGRRVADRPTLYRLSSSAVFKEMLEGYLTWPEWVSITGGLPWAPATTYDRHNVLATELGLRFAEYAEVGTVLGERFSSFDLLAGSGIGREPLRHKRAADLTLVRPDGMRIAIELTAHYTPNLARKVAHWVRLLHERPFATSGLCVVFVVAPRPELLGDSKGHRARAKVYKAIAAATKEFPGTTRDRVAERIGVATWREWFPARGRVSDAFLAMRVDRATGLGAAAWEPCDMLDPTSRPFAPADTFDATAILANAAMLGQTPYWLRGRSHPPELWRLLLERAGVAGLHSATPLPRMLGLG